MAYVISVLDIQAELFLRLVTNLEVQKAFKIILEESADWAWEFYDGLPPGIEPPPILLLQIDAKRPGDGRVHPHIPARDLVWAVIIGHILRVESFLRLEWLVHSPVRGTGHARPVWG